MNSTGSYESCINLMNEKKCVEKYRSKGVLWSYFTIVY